MEFFMMYVAPRLSGIPYYVIWLGGIMYAIVYRKRHPRASLFAGIALAIMLLNNIFSAVYSAYIQYQSFNNGFASAVEYGQRLTMLSFITIPFSMLAWVLLLIATFGWKKLTEAEAVESDKPQEFLL